ATMRLIRAGQTLAVFQIESPGQWHLLAQTQPERFDDLIVQTALFRPGPIQGGFVRPYVARRREQVAQRAGPEGQGGSRQQERGEARTAQHARTAQQARDAVQGPWPQGEVPDAFWTEHAVLGPILRDSAGILLFQEQILEIAHQFAGLTYAEADG